MKEFKQERPSWCPHSNSCQFKRRVLDNLCGGELPEPIEHEGDFNTHRICWNDSISLKHSSVNFYEVLDLQVNKSDLDWFRWIFDALDGKKTSSLSFNEVKWNE